MSYFRLKTGTMPQITLIGSVTVHPNYVHTRRQLNEYVMYIIVNGGMELMENDREYLLKQNDVIILSPEYEHYGIRGTECEYYYIHFTAEMEEVQEDENMGRKMVDARFGSLKNDRKFGDRDRDIIMPNYHHFTNSAAVISIISKVGDIINAEKDRREHFALKADCMLMEMLIAYTRSYTSELLIEAGASSAKVSGKVMDLLNYFNSYYMEAISGDSIEELLGCNFDYLNRVFKQSTGKTIFNYLNEMRITKAKQLLENGFHSISDVAEMTGFNDAYYFSKVFKKYAGTTPGKYSRSVM